MIYSKYATPFIRYKDNRDLGCIVSVSRQDRQLPIRLTLEEAEGMPVPMVEIPDHSTECYRTYLRSDCSNLRLRIAIAWGIYLWRSFIERLIMTAVVWGLAAKKPGRYPQRRWLGSQVQSNRRRVKVRR